MKILKNNTQPIMHDGTFGIYFEYYKNEVDAISKKNLTVSETFF